MRSVRETQWWLMWCDFPNLNWARLRVYDDGSADVFDSDGRTQRFLIREDAIHSLLEDEYQELHTLDENDEEDLGVPLATIRPPAGVSDDELLSQMYMRAG